MLLYIINTLFILLNIACGIYDFSFYRIPNVLIIALLVLYAFFATLYLVPQVILVSLVVAVVVLVVCLALYAWKILGAGDVKYIAAISLWAGAPNIVHFLLYMAVLGGVVAVMYLIFPNLLRLFSDKVWQFFQKLESSCPIFKKMWLGSEKGAEGGIRQKIDTKKIPYGLAVASAAIIAISLHL